MRASFDGLALAVKERLGADAKSARAMYLFVNRRRNLAKVLWRDATGWCVLAKRLDTRLIELPASVPEGATSLAIDGRALAALLDGVEPRRETVRDIVRQARLAVSIRNSCLSSRAEV
jgi:transposase